MQNPKTHPCPACGQEAYQYSGFGSLERFSCNCGNAFQTEKGVVTKSTKEAATTLSDDEEEHCHVCDTQLVVSEETTCLYCPNCSGGEFELYECEGCGVEIVTTMFCDDCDQCQDCCNCDNEDELYCNCEGSCGNHSDDICRDCNKCPDCCECSDEDPYASYWAGAPW